MNMEQDRFKVVYLDPEGRRHETPHWMSKEEADEEARMTAERRGDVKIWLENYDGTQIPPG